MITGLTIADLFPQVNSDISELTTKVEISYTMDGASQVRFVVVDDLLRMLKQNYFQIRRVVRYTDESFEIATVSTAQGDGKEPYITCEARSQAIQAMKRDKTPASYGGVSATDYARIVAERFGLTFVGEPTSTRRAVIQASTPDRIDSVWDVLQRSASESQFVAFESNGTLYFASQRWLIGKWGNYTLTYPSSDTDGLVLLEVPQCRKSDDDPLVAEFSAVLARPNATSLRPGMTVTLSGMGEFDIQYVITEVSYEEGVNDPIGISARTPEKEIKK